MNNIINIINEIEYFKNDNNGTKIKLNNRSYIYRYSAKHFLNTICQINLTTIKSYNESLNKIFGYKYSNPYCLKNITLIQIGNINSYETIWVNYNKIKHIKYINKKETILIFDNKNQININKNLKYIKKQIEKIEAVKRYLCKL